MLRFVCWTFGGAFIGFMIGAIMHDVTDARFFPIELTFALGIIVGSIGGATHEILHAIKSERRPSKPPLSSKGKPDQTDAAT